MWEVALKCMAVISIIQTSLCELTLEITSYSATSISTTLPWHFGYNSIERTLWTGVDSVLEASR